MNTNFFLAYRHRFIYDVEQYLHIQIYALYRIVKIDISNIVSWDF